ncbi:conserved protein of unknown function [Ectopseudomonas oleovorans]|uniref:Uncharacterized protein n=1 Tax=Ectopseudomonas oleovorans TaxID=301 RepID=A0A653B6A6_ECTOL|nr:conserved protein of unknown function [Pseudomonas oleovorans]
MLHLRRPGGLVPPHRLAALASPDLRGLWRDAAGPGRDECAGTGLIDYRRHRNNLTARSPQGG